MSGATSTMKKNKARQGEEIRGKTSLIRYSRKTSPGKQHRRRDLPMTRGQATLIFRGRVVQAKGKASRWERLESESVCGTAGRSEHPGRSERRGEQQNYLGPCQPG